MRRINQEPDLLCCGTAVSRVQLMFACEHFLGAECCRPSVRVHQLLKEVLPNLHCVLELLVVFLA